MSGFGAWLLKRPHHPFVKIRVSFRVIRVPLRFSKRLRDSTKNAPDMCPGRSVFDNQKASSTVSVDFRPQPRRRRRHGVTGSGRGRLEQLQDGRTLLLLVVEHLLRDSNINLRAELSGLNSTGHVHEVHASPFSKQLQELSTVHHSNFDRFTRIPARTTTAPEQIPKDSLDVSVLFGYCSIIQSPNAGSARWQLDDINAIAAFGQSTQVYVTRAVKLSSESRE